MGEEKKKGSVLPPYNDAEIQNAATAKAGGSLPKGLILVKEKRELMHADSIQEGAALYSYSVSGIPNQAERNRQKEKNGKVAVLTKKGSGNS